MEENKLTPRDQLKTYFETGKRPTQNQFSNLLDSLRHKEDGFTKRELILFANSMAYIDNTFVYYLASNVGNLELQVVIASADEEDQMITIRDTTKIGMIRQFLLGNAPYTIKVKKTLGGDLKENEYYSLSYQLMESYKIYRLFGNNLPGIPDGFDFGDLKMERLPIEINKIDNGQKINVVNTRIGFVNNTAAPIQYRAYSQYWGSEYGSKDIVTDHYDLWDFLYISYNADLRNISQNIHCDVYDADSNTLITTGILSAGQNQENWWGGQIDKVRNIRIECHNEPK